MGCFLVGHRTHPHHFAEDPVKGGFCSEPRFFGDMDKAQVVIGTVRQQVAGIFNAQLVDKIAEIDPIFLIDQDRGIFNIGKEHSREVVH